MAAAPNAFPLGTLRCKKLKHDRERERERERRKRRRRGATEIQLPLEKGIPDTVTWPTFLRFSSRSSSVLLKFPTFRVRLFPGARGNVVVRVYNGSTNDRPVYRHVAGRKSFGGRRSWTTKVDRANRDLLSRVEGFEFAVNRKASASTTHKTPSVVHTRAVFRRRPAALSASSLNKFQHAEEFVVVRVLPQPS